MSSDRINKTPVVEAAGLKKRYGTGWGSKNKKHAVVNAVDGVDLKIFPGETFGIVGESGCGKSTVARLLMRLERPSEGTVVFDGQRIDNLPEGKLRKIRDQFQMVFQDSSASLNPRKRVFDILSETLLYHHRMKKEDAVSRVAELLALVGLPEEAMYRYPHEFSGGQRQRICIAPAIALEPKLLVLDEPVSALDVSVQAQILNLIKDLQSRLGLTCLFIGHGLGAVHYVSHRIAVMYLGKIVEFGDAEEIFSNPAHPYTRALLDATPVADPKWRRRERILLSGEIKSGNSDGHPCAFFERCPFACEQCDQRDIHMRPVAPGSTHESCCCEAFGKDMRMGKIAPAVQTGKGE